MGPLILLFLTILAFAVSEEWQLAYRETPVMVDPILEVEAGTSMLFEYVLNMVKRHLFIDSS
jgi:autonomous glycyl radical cofactor GrcA